MSDMIEKIICTGKDNSDAWIPAVLNNKNNQWDNPFIYLVWMMFANRYFGNEANNPQNTAIQSQLEALRTQMGNNQNSNMIMDALKGINIDVNQLAQNLNCDYNSLRDAICLVQQGIAKVSGEIGFSAERIINAGNMGDCRIIEAVKDCCCTTQKLILEQGYQNQLAQKDQMFATQAGFDRTNTGLERGFSAVAFQAQQDKCDIIRAGQDNTQRIIDTLNNHWKDEQANLIQDLKFQLSQERQTRMFMNRLNGCGGNDCGGCNGSCF